MIKYTTKKPSLSIHIKPSPKKTLHLPTLKIHMFIISKGNSHTKLVLIILSTKLSWTQHLRHHYPSTTTNYPWFSSIILLNFLANPKYNILIKHVSPILHTQLQKLPTLRIFCTVRTTKD